MVKSKVCGGVQQPQPAEHSRRKTVLCESKEAEGGGERERTVESTRDHGDSMQRAGNQEADSTELEDLEGGIPDDPSQDLMLELTTI